MNLVTARLYAALLGATISTFFHSSIKRITASYSDIYDRDNITVLAAISLTLGVVATIVAPFVMPMLAWWEVAVITPAVMVTGVVVLSMAQTIATMAVNAATAIYSMVTSLFTSAKAVGA